MELGDPGVSGGPDDLGDLPATAFLTVLARAEATRDPRAGLVDEFAARFAELCPPAILRITRGTAGTSVVVARTLAVDRLVAAVAAERAVDVWVNLGAGFDARPQRLAWAAGSVVVEVDSAAVFDVKDRLLPTAGTGGGVAVERLRCDIRDLPQLREVLRPRIEGRSVVFLAEGLLPYFPGEFVGRLAGELAGLAGAGAGAWICDVVSTDSARVLSGASRAAGSRLELFGLDGLAAFEANGWVCDRLDLLPTARPGPVASRLPDSVLLLRTPRW